MKALLIIAAMALISAGSAFAQSGSEGDKPLQRAMGGEAVSYDEFPWQVALVISAANDVAQGQYCGGTLIAPRWVLTAAHCFADEESPYVYGGECGGHDFMLRANQISVYGRSENLEGNGVLVDAARVICHTDYDMRTNHNDIALIELVSPINVPQYARLASSGSPSETEMPGRIAMVTGWGVYRIEGAGSSEGTMEGGTSRAYSATLLQGVEVPIVSDADCARAYDNRITVDERHICAGLINRGRDTCRGDSGGPLQVLSNENVYYQIGIVSWGRRCESGGYYNIYTQVSNYVEWINRNTGLSLGSDDTDPIGEPIEDEPAEEYELIELEAGFWPDTYQVALDAGGTFSAVEVSPDCRGYVTSGPNAVLDYAADSRELSITATSERDTTLVIFTPGEEWICSDDMEGIHPGVVLEDPESGLYSIWIGTYFSSDGRPAASLNISELGPQF